MTSLSVMKWPLLSAFLLGVLCTWGATLTLLARTTPDSPDAAMRGGQYGVGESCLLRLADCDLGCLDWTIVLSVGQPGSNTLQEMMSKLPGMNFHGEEGGLLEAMREVQAMHEVQKMEYRKGEHGRTYAWRGATDDTATNVACLAQKLYAERHGASCLHRGCRHGWKEIRYSSPDMVEWIRTVFPASNIVVNYQRNPCPENSNSSEDILDNTCQQVEFFTRGLLAEVENLKNTFYIETEELNNLTKWGELAEFLGYKDCDAQDVLVENRNMGNATVGQEDMSNPWTCATGGSEAQENGVYRL